MYLSDMHTHSIASGHGTRCTITDMARKASERGLRLLGITDHGPATLSAGTASYFRSLTYSSRNHFGIELMYGVELNILDTEGRIDLDQSLLNKMDYAIASMHRQNYAPGSIEENTRAYLNVMKNPVVKILGHSDNPAFPADYERLASFAASCGVIFEINEASLRPGSYRGNARPNALEILRVSRKYGLPILLSSDSHGTGSVADFTYASRLVHEAIFPENQILNNQIPRLKAFLGTHE